MSVSNPGHFSFWRKNFRTAAFATPRLRNAISSGEQAYSPNQSGDALEELDLAGDLRHGDDIASTLFICQIKRTLRAAPDN